MKHSLLVLLLFLCPTGIRSQNCTLSAPLPQATLIRSCSYLLTWNKVLNVDHYEVKYKLSNTSAWLNTISTGQDTVLMISGLLAREKYENKVIAFCANERHGGENMLNVKTAKCSVPAVTSITVQQDTSVHITWDGCASAFNAIRYRFSGNSIWTTVNCEANQFATLTGLTYNAWYQFEIKGCISSANVNWSLPDSFRVLVAHYKPNIVILLVDDGSYDSYLPNGGPGYFTSPSINRIAYEGVNFKNFFVTLSLCNPSRATLLTGLMPNHHNVMSNQYHLNTSFPTIGSILHDNGYYTSFLGKYPDISDVSPRTGWDYWMAFLAGSGQHQNGNYNLNGSETEITGYNDYNLMDSAIGIIQSKAHAQPFMILVSYSGVHEPYLAPPGMDNIYNNSEVTVPENFHYFEKNYPSNIYNGTEYHDTASCLQDIRDNFEMLNGIDTTVQRLFTTLDALNLTDSTMIIYTSDNGFLQGQHLLHGKRLAYEPSMRVPLFIRYPEWFIPNSEVINPLTLNIDLAPTILDAAGITGTYNMDGYSLREYAAGSRDRDVFYYESSVIDNYRSVRSKVYKYIWYNCDSNSTEEFFNLITDPNEDTNHIHTASYQILVAGYRLKMDSLKKFWGDTILNIKLGQCHLADIFYDRFLQEGNAGPENSLLLYPDPATDLLQIYWEGKTSLPNHMMIFDASGILKFETFDYDGLNQHLLEVDVALFPNGLYQMIVEAGSEMKRGKFLVMK